MIEWNEEDIQFLANSLINPLVDVIIKNETESIEAYQKMFDAIANRINELQYCIVKDRSFMLAHLGVIMGSGEHIQEKYNQYSEEYDKRNKSLLDKKDE